MTRKLRTKMEGVQEEALEKPMRSITIQAQPQDLDLTEKVDAYAGRLKILQAEAEAYKRKIEVVAQEAEELSSILLATAKEREITKMEGRTAIITVLPTTKAEISPRKLLSWLKKTKQVARFWEVLKVGIGDAKASFGEKVLRNEGILTEDTNKYSRLKVADK